MPARFLPYPSHHTRTHRYMMDGSPGPARSKKMSPEACTPASSSYRRSGTPARHAAAHSFTLLLARQARTGKRARRFRLEKKWRGFTPRRVTRATGQAAAGCPVRAARRGAGASGGHAPVSRAGRRWREPMRGRRRARWYRPVGFLLPRRNVDRTRTSTTPA